MEWHELKNERNVFLMGMGFFKGYDQHKSVEYILQIGQIIQVIAIWRMIRNRPWMFGKSTLT